MNNSDKHKNSLNKINKWNIASFLLVFVAMPAIIIFSLSFLGSNKFFFMSAGLVIIILLVFFFIFEGNKPDARTVIIIAVMSATAVAGRAIFFFAPQFKPILAVIILTGICFGRNVGFITGAMSAFISNFIFGQGPWTPWQMLAMGIIGYIAGLLFDDGKNGRRKNRYKNHKLLMTVLYCVFGFISVFFIYGGLVDIWTIFGFYEEPNLRIIITTYALASWMNFVHAGATVLFLVILVVPMKSKLDRIKVKYGLVSS